MKDFSIILLKNPDAGVRHYSLSSNIFYVLLLLLLSSISALGYLYYYQHQKISHQQHLIMQQESIKVSLQQEISAFSDQFFPLLPLVLIDSLRWTPITGQLDKV